MRIAMLAPIAWRTPPRHYGPWEQVVSLLTEGLVRRGVDVTLFATADSVTSAHLRGICPTGYEEDRDLDAKVWEGLHISEVFERADEFDLIHNHFDFLPLTYSRLTATPLVVTIHGFSSDRILPVYRKYQDTAHYVAISDADRAPDLRYAATVHHGIDLAGFTFRPTAGEYLLFFGRIHPDKGAHEAIQIARQTGRRLIMAGVIQDEAYFRTQVEPHLDGDRVTYVGSADPARRDELLGGALALLHPIAFDEPFGLSVVEAMACGTPVVAFERGSMREVIADGETGFLVESVEEAVGVIGAAGAGGDGGTVGSLAAIDRSACRRWVEEHFSVDRMVDGYMAVYERVLDLSAREDHRPWGYYKVLEDEPNHKTKRIVVLPGARLSLQRHRRRSEHWHVVSGRAGVTRDDEELLLGAGDSVDIPTGAAHRMANPGTEPLTFIEVQRGDYFGEDDIERLEDDFGRS
ncbi:MAG: glycosyltransferase [Thermoleophilia bacterium]